MNKSDMLLNSGLVRITDDFKILKFYQSTNSWQEAPLINSGRGGKYKIVTIEVDGKQYREYVHRLIATKFIPNPDNKSCVNHIDGNGHNNHPSNLEWVTHSENTQHAIENGLLNHKTKECVFCGEQTGSPFSVCTICRDRINKEQVAESARKNILSDFRKLRLTSIQGDTLEIFSLRLDGFTLDEIGKQRGCSRQNIQQMLKSKLDKDEMLKAKDKKNTIRKIRGGSKYENLCFELEKLGFRDYELADVLGISQPTLRKKLNGYSPWTLNEAVKIKNLLGVKTDIETLFKIA